jgi:hypothetical protein
MKRIVLTGSLICLGFIAASAATTPSDGTNGSNSSKSKESRKEKRLERQSEVDYFTIQQFERDFPDAVDVVFSKGKVFDEANFVLDEKTYTAFYDNENNLVGTTTEKKFSDLPKRAKSYINKKYGDYAVEKVILFDDNESNPTDMWMYDQRFADEDNYFVELKKENKVQIVQVALSGNCYDFKTL